MTTSGERYTVPALSRGLALLAQFTRDERELSGAELSRRLDLPRASVFRMLLTLEQMGFVERAGDSGAYKLSLGVLRLGFEYLASMEIAEYGRPVIESLRDASGYSAHVVVRDLRDVVIVAKAAGHNTQFHSIQVGARLPVHATVLGRILLGGMKASDLAALYADQKLTAHTPQTPTTVDALYSLVVYDFARGWGVSQGGFESGISTIAAPVRNEHDEVTAAISITVPSSSIAADQALELAKLVCEAANQLTQRLRHTQQTKPKNSAHASLLAMAA
jgi:DNA-binding IclR family transcriptional regulator